MLRKCLFLITNIPLKAGLVLVIMIGIPIVIILCGIGWVFVYENLHDLYGYVDKLGHFIIPPRYSAASHFQNGQAGVVQEVRSTDLWSECKGRWRHKLNHQGQIIGKSEFTHEECYLPLEFKPREPEAGDQYPFINSEMVDGGLAYGYKSKNGNWLIKPEFDKAYRFENGIAWVRAKRGDRWLWGFINKEGKYVLEPKCISAGEFHEGLAVCSVRTVFGIPY